MTPYLPLQILARVQVALLESEVAELKVESRQTSRLLADMTAQRDRLVCHGRAVKKEKIGFRVCVEAQHHCGCSCLSVCKHSSLACVKV